MSGRASSQSCHTVIPSRAGANLMHPTDVENAMTPMLADKVDFVIGVDTHRDSHTAAVITATGGLKERLTVATDAFGFRELDAFAAAHARGRRVWAVEGTGSFGAGLTTHLLKRGEWVVEIDRPARPARRDGAKSDDLDAVRTAREALTLEHLAAPRARGDREAMRVLLTAREGAILARTKAIRQLKAMIVNAPRRCAISCAAAPLTNSSTAAHASAPCHHTPSNTGPRCVRSGPPRGVHSCSKLKQQNTKPNSSSS
ncbi:IS110 family transposase [Mycobacterium servetii]|uniref:Transposase n=1 Tax=Mycobacterium servetii TaxID=3237418 RepID=A0ABV4C7H4_9MYCO